MKKVTKDWRTPALIAAGVVILILLGVIASTNKNNTLVTVNTLPINEADLVQTLKHRYGDSLLAEMISDRLIGLQAEKKGIQVSAGDIDQLLNFQRFTTMLQGSTLEQELENSGMSLDDLRANLTTQTLLIKMIVPEADRTAAFKTMAAQLSYPPQFKYREMIFLDKATAAKAVEELRHSEGDSAVHLMEAAQYSLDAGDAQAEKMYLPIPGMEEPIRTKALLSLQPGGVSDPLPLPASVKGKGVENYRRVIQLVNMLPGEKATPENRDMVVGMLLMQKDAKKYAMAQRDLQAEALNSIDVHFQTDQFPSARKRFQETKLQNQPIPAVDPSRLPSVPDGQ